MVCLKIVKISFLMPNARNKHWKRRSLIISKTVTSIISLTAPCPLACASLIPLILPCPSNIVVDQFDPLVPLGHSFLPLTLPAKPLSLLWSVTLIQHRQQLRTPSQHTNHLGCNHPFTSRFPGFPSTTLIPTLLPWTLPSPWRTRLPWTIPHTIILHSLIPPRSSVIHLPSSLMTVPPL